jgi:hypothetical protein
MSKPAVGVASPIRLIQSDATPAGFRLTKKFRNPHILLSVCDREFQAQTDQLLNKVQQALLLPSEFEVLRHPSESSACRGAAD